MNPLISKSIKTIIFFIFCIVLSYQGQAQVSGEIDYGVKLLFNPVDSLDQLEKEAKKEPDLIDFSRKIEQSRKLLPLLKFTLKFNNSKAFYFRQAIMANDFDENVLEYALILSNAKENHFTDLSSNSIIVYKESELGEKKYLVKKKNHNWKLSDETKEIAGYLCRKATTQEKRNEIITLKITAWYAPDLPYNFGPKNFAGLPGMILGLEEHGFYFYAKDVNLKEKERKIKQPKGEIIEEENYIQLVEQYYEDVINNY